jgi:hypothetical protein
MFRFERKHERLAPLSVFIRRLLSSLFFGCSMVGVALFLGIAGYHWIAGFGWVDSLLEASMILGGMGPINPLSSQGAKLFASAYALFSGLVFIAIMGVILAPIIHRIMHSFHLDEQGKSKK